MSDFVELLEPEARMLAQLLLNEGLRVVSFRGPLPSDAWQLELERNRIVIVFEIEGGVTDGVLFRHPAIHIGRGPDESGTPLGVAWFVWARVHQEHYSLTDMDQLWSIDGISSDVLQILDWLPNADIPMIEAVYEEWHKTQRSDLPNRGWNPTAGISAVEDAVARG